MDGIHLPQNRTQWRVVMKLVPNRMSCSLTSWGTISFLRGLCPVVWVVLLPQTAESTCNNFQVLLWLSEEVQSRSFFLKNRYTRFTEWRCLSPSDVCMTSVVQWNNSPVDKVEGIIYAAIMKVWKCTYSRIILPHSFCFMRWYKNLICLSVLGKIV